MSFGWITLGESVDLISGATFKSERFTEKPDDVPLVKGENLQQAMVDWGIAKKWPQNDLESYSKFFLEPDDIVVAMDRPWVPAGLKWAFITTNDPRSLLVQRVARLRARAGFSPLFLRYVIASRGFSDYVKNIMGGTNVPHISGDQIRAFRFLSPRLDVQERIGGMLSVYDSLIENNRRRIRLLEESARLLYREWFVYLRFPGHEHVKVVDGMPDGWERKPLGELLTLQRGFDLPASDRIDGEFPIYAATGIHGYHNKAMVSGPGVVTGRSGSLGSVLYAPTDFWPLNTTLWVKEFKAVSPEFSYFLLGGLNLGQLNGGVAVPTLNRNDVHRVEVLLPPKVLMDEFSGAAVTQLQQVDKLTQYNEKLREARDLLLPRLMSGEIEV